MNPTPPLPNLRAPGISATPGMSQPLSAEHYQVMRNAKVKRKKIDVAIGVATFNGWSLGLFAGLSALLLVFSLDLLSLIITLGLAVVAYREFTGRAMLRDLNPQGARLLGYNQIALGGLIVCYCLWSLAAAIFGQGAYAQTIQEHPELSEVLGSTGDLIQFVTIVVYSIAIVLTIPYQALIAWYYFSREKHVIAYVDQTPEWVTQIQKAAA